MHWQLEQSVLYRYEGLREYRTRQCILLLDPPEANKYLLDFPIMNGRIKLARAQSCLKINTNRAHPLHNELVRAKRNRLMRRESWINRAEEAIRELRPPENIDSGQEWVPASKKLSRWLYLFILHLTEDEENILVLQQMLRSKYKLVKMSKMVMPLFIQIDQCKLGLYSQFR